MSIDVQGLIRRVISDPGSVTPRGTDNEGTPYTEPLPAWSARAVVERALPPIVADELRRWADDLHELRQSMSNYEREHGPVCAAMAEFVGQMRRRVAELEQQGGAR